MPDLIDEEQLFHSKIAPEFVGRTYRNAVETEPKPGMISSEESGPELDSDGEEFK